MPLTRSRSKSCKPRNIEELSDNAYYKFKFHYSLLGSDAPTRVCPSSESAAPVSIFRSDKLREWGLSKTGLTDYTDGVNFPGQYLMPECGIKVHYLEVVSLSEDELHAHKQRMRSQAHSTSLPLRQREDEARRLLTKLRKSLETNEICERGHYELYIQQHYVTLAQGAAPVAPPVAADVVTSAGAGAVGVSSSLLVKRGISQAGVVGEPPAKRRPGQR